MGPQATSVRGLKLLVRAADDTIPLIDQESLANLRKYFKKASVQHVMVCVLVSGHDMRP
jgi:hypothetical protein